MKSISHNTAWITGSRILNLSVGLLIGAVVTRHLGPSGMGTLSYALSLVSLTAGLGTFGLSVVSVHELVKGDFPPARILGSSFLLRFIGILFSLIIAVTIFLVIGPKDTTTQYVFACASITALFSAQEVISFWFMSGRNARPIAIADICRQVATSGMKLVLVAAGASVIAFGNMLVVDAAVGTTLLLVVYRTAGQQITAWRYDAACFRRLLKSGVPLAVSSLFYLVTIEVDKLLLAHLRGTAELGMYAAAVRLSDAWYFVPSALIESSFPSLITAYHDGELFKRRLQLLFDSLVLCCIPIAIIISIFSKSFITLLYGAAFTPAAAALSIHVWSGLFLFLSVACGRRLILEDRGSLLIVRGLIGAGVNVLVCLLLIPRYGMSGAAIATLAAYMCMLVSLMPYGSNAKPVLRALCLLNLPETIRLLRRKWQRHGAS